MRNGRVIMGTAARQFEDVNKKYLRQGALVRRRFLLNGFLGDDAAVGGIGVFARACGSPLPRPLPPAGGELVFGKVIPSPQRRLGPITPVDLAIHTS